MGICASTVKNPRKAITPKQALIAYNRCSAQCFYCRADIAPFKKRLNRWEVDHVLSVHKNGKSTVDNYVASCKDCNQNKKARAVSEWLSSKSLSRRCIWVAGNKYCGADCVTNTQKYCVVHQWERVFK